jgi:phosphoribosylanthranilate isomerase
MSETNNARANANANAKVKVKICGLSRAEDIAAVNRALPDYIGFVFAPSRRRVDMRTAAMLKHGLDSRIEAVGVFVNEQMETVIQAYKSGIIDLVQLHGDENDGYIRRLKESCGCRVIKAIGVGDTMPDLPSGPDYLLFDTLPTMRIDARCSPDFTYRGGIGKTFDWNILESHHDLPYFLAGGLNKDNVSKAVRILAPYCVDVSSGVETDGLKDEKKIEEFMFAARE